MGVFRARQVPQAALDLQEPRVQQVRLDQLVRRVQLEIQGLLDLLEIQGLQE